MTSWWVDGNVVWRIGLILAVLIILRPMPESSQISDWWKQGEAATQARQFEQAEETYAQALNLLSEDSVPLFDRLVAVSLAQEHYSHATVYLYALADRDGWTLDRLGQLRYALEKSGQSNLSLALAYNSLSRNEGDPDDLRRIAHLQISQHAWSELEATLNAWLQLAPDDGEALFLMGLQLAPVDVAGAAAALEKARTTQAVAEQATSVLRALKAYDGQPPTAAHTELGICLIGLEEWEWAERALQMALDVNAVNPTALAYLGFALDQQGRDGLSSLQAALHMSPNDPELHYLLGLHWRLAGDDRAAYETLYHAFWLDPDNPALAVEMGATLQHMSDLTGAEEWYSQAVTLAPEEAAWTRTLAAFYADTGFHLETKGVKFIEDAHAKWPGDMDTQVSMGWAYQQTGQHEQAHTLLSDALLKSPENWRGRYYFGIVLEHWGDRQGAVEAYEAVVAALGPHDGFGLLAARALERFGG